MRTWIKLWPLTEMPRSLRTRAIHDGNAVDPATGAVVPPIHFASTFAQESPGEWRPFDYSRSGNPTRSDLQRTLASLDDAVGALAFSTGMAAIHAVMMTLHSGDHVIAGCDLYGGAYRLLHQICNRSGISVSLVDLTDLTAIEAAITPSTRLIWGETIGNPRLSIPDWRQIASLASDRGIRTGVDNTFGTPALMRPLNDGVDIVMHSATKYLGGHSDCLGGTLAVSDESLLAELAFIQNATGAVLDPMSCFLVARGLKTLDLRMQAQSATAMQLARWLESDERIRRVLYPGLASHDHHERAAQIFSASQDADPIGFGAMITFEVNGDLDATKRVCKQTELFHLAVSLGAVESLIEQPATMSHASYDAAARKRFGITDSLVRISVGLESVGDLQADLEQALAASVDA